MIHRKILWTCMLELLYSVAAVSGDYVLNIVVGHNPAAFSPVSTTLITLVVGAPVTYYLISQHFNMRRLIADRVRLEAELMGALSAAEAATRAKSDFLANMTHELRTPLNAIVGFSGVLRKSSTLSGPDMRHVKLVNDASQALLHVVNDVLDLSKMESTEIRFESKPFSPIEMTRSALALMSTQAEQKGLEIRLSAPDHETWLLGDCGRLQQVLLNFLSNAIKFTPHGHIEVVVDVRLEGQSGRLRIEVRDSGIGVSPEQIQTIFERFTQVDASISRQFGGTGLGLAISKRILTALGGEIGASSIVGEGSTFWFELTTEVSSSGNPLSNASDHAAVLDQEVRLLLVDDNPINQELISVLLEPFSVTIETASDGLEAVAAATQRRFDIILMDVQMPRLDGLSATRRIRSLADPGAGRTPIIAMTANVLPEQVARCLDAGMDGHLGKPIIPEALLSTISHWLEAEGSEVPEPRSDPPEGAV